MADFKYGQIFTKDDVAELINVATAAATLGNVLDVDSVIARFEHEQGQLTFPADEPTFTLRAKDECASQTIATVKGEIFRDYVGNCFAAECPEEHINSALYAAREMRDWQIDHRDLVKTPD